MPRRHNREKAKAKSLALRQKKKAEEKLQKASMLHNAEGKAFDIHAQAAEVYEKLFDHSAFPQMSYDSELECMLLFDSNGIVRSTLTKNEISCRWKALNKRWISRYELLQCLASMLEDCSDAQLRQLLDALLDVQAS